MATPIRVQSRGLIRAILPFVFSSQASSKTLNNTTHIVVASFRKTRKWHSGHLKPPAFAQQHEGFPFHVVYPHFGGTAHIHHKHNRHVTFNAMGHFKPGAAVGKCLLDCTYIDIIAMFLPSAKLVSLRSGSSALRKSETNNA